MKKINNVISNISENFARILFGVIIIGMFFINSIYVYDDSPGFKTNNIFNYLGILFNLMIVIVCIVFDRFILYKYSRSKRKIVQYMAFLLYIALEILYIKTIPIVPFSDMQNVTTIALSNFTDGMEYLQIYPNNLPITIVFNLIFRVTTYNFFVLKIFNILCNVVTIYFAHKIYCNVYKNESEITLLLGIASISTFLYVNCIYTDIIFTSLVTIIIYIVTKQRKSSGDIVIISILSFIQFKIRPVGIILIIALIMYYLLKCMDYKKIFILVITVLVCNLIYSKVERIFIPEDTTMTYPIWSFIQMGINEKEFGFQDSSHSTDWTYQDVKTRLNDLGAKRLIKLLLKKHLWMWTEGTYQVERYAFGTGQPEQYSYQNSIVKEVSDVNNSKIRNSLEYIMKGEFFILILLALVDVIVKDEDDYTRELKDIFLYVIIGIFCFYTIWEIKSRYIYCLFPIFLILASGGIDKIKRFSKSRCIRDKSTS